MAAAPAGSAEAEGRATTGAAQGATGVAEVHGKEEHGKEWHRHLEDAGT